MGKCQLVPKGRPWLGSNPLPSPAKSKMSHRCVVPKWQVAGGRRCRWIPLRDDARSCQSFDSGKQVLIVNGEWWSWTVQHLRQSLYVISRCRLCRFKFPIGILSFRPALFWSNQLTGRHTQHICYTYIYIYMPSGYLTVCHGTSTMLLRTVNHLFLWAIYFPWLC